MIITKIGVPFTLRGIQYILPPATAPIQPCQDCVFFNKKYKNGGDPCILNSKYRHYIIKACSGHASVYRKFKESKNE